MKNYLLIFFIATAMDDSFAQTLDAEQIYKKVNNAVVQVYAYDSDSKILSQGSGVVLNDKGWIVTNYHVYNGSDRLIVKHNEKIIDYSEIIGVDADKDILILKIADHTFPSIMVGNSDSVNVGQRIYAIGSPSGLENTMTEGIISGLRSYDEHTKNYIQISASISHGSSGGAVVNTKGELIGICARSVVEGQNLNFAIPVNDVMKVYNNEGVTKNDLIAADYFSKGAKEYDAGNYEKAIENYKKAISLNSNGAVAHNNLGLAYAIKGDYDVAILNYRKAIAIDPNCAIAYSNLGLAFDKKGDYDAAIFNYKKAIEINPNFAMAYYNLGVVYGEKGNPDVELSYYKKAIAINPNNAEAYNNLGVIYGDKGDRDNEISCYKKAIAINPNYAEAYNNLSIAFKEKDDYYNSKLYKEKADKLKLSLKQ